MLYIGGDHAGYKLKEQVKKYLDRVGIAYKDLGPLKLVPTDDYPDYGLKVARAVAKNEKHAGILICGSGVGVCVVANKVRDIRAVQAHDLRDAKLAREHTDANVLCLSGWELSALRAIQIIKKFLGTPFSGEERHKRRLAKIKTVETK